MKLREEAAEERWRRRRMRSRAARGCSLRLTRMEPEAAGQQSRAHNCLLSPTPLRVCVRGPATPPGEGGCPREEEEEEEQAFIPMELLF